MPPAPPSTQVQSAQPIVVIEDEDAIRDVVEYNLVREGFRVLTAGDGIAGLDCVRRHQPRLVVLDLMLPGLDGLELCRLMRADAEMRTVPVIMLTARGEESDIVLGLGTGADDYLTKPFSPRELVARVHALLRRHPAGEEVDPSADNTLPRLDVDGIVVDPARHEVVIDGRTERFTRTELRLLYALLRRPGRVFTRDQLLTQVMGEGAWVTERTIDVHVRAIRSKLADRADVVETVRGVGYRARDARTAVAGAPPGG